MKRRISVLLAVILAAGLTACAGKTENELGDTSKTTDENATASPQTAIPLPEKMTAVIDRDGNKLGEIDGRGWKTAVDGGMIYSVFAPGENQFSAPAQYHFYSLKDNSDKLLGTLGDQGYEAYYTRAELDGKLYTLAVEGNPMDYDADVLYLLALDPAAGTMKKYPVSSHGFPYTSMAVADGKLLIMNHETSDDRSHKIYEFDPAGESIREVLTIPDTEASLRGICAGDNGFYLLKLHLEEGKEAQMYLDFYDLTYSRQSELDVTNLFTAAIMDVHGIMNRSDALNELGYHVSHFCVVDGRVLVYHNFDLSCVAVDIVSSETVFAKDDLYNVDAVRGTPILYRTYYSPADVDVPEIYSVTADGLKAIGFTSVGDYKLIQNISVSRSGTWAVTAPDDMYGENGTTAVYLFIQDAQEND